jgi:hypothetical protein
MQKIISNCNEKASSGWLHFRKKGLHLKESKIKILYRLYHILIILVPKDTSLKKRNITTGTGIGLVDKNHKQIIEPFTGYVHHQNHVWRNRGDALVRK